MHQEKLFALRSRVYRIVILVSELLGLIVCATPLLHWGSSKVRQIQSRPEAVEAARPVASNVLQAIRTRGRKNQFTSIPGPNAPVESSHVGLLEKYGQLPLSFEANQGQTNERAKFLSHGRGYTLFLTQNEAVLAMRTAPRKVRNESERRQGTPSYSIVRVRLRGGHDDVKVRGEQELIGKTNYFVGNDPSKWRTNVPTYARVRYESVYRGVDLIYYGHQGDLESDFIVAPGTDPRVIRLEMAGAEEVRINKQGDLEFRTAGEKAVLGKPVAYQRNVGTKGPKRTRGRHLIPARYVMKGKQVVGFDVGEYDKTELLIIDPVLVYSTYLGGNGTGEVGTGIAVDATGSVYLTGETNSTNFPTQDALAGTLAGEFDAFVAKLNAAGNALVYSTYLGGSNQDYGQGIAVDAAGNAYVTGHTKSANFPVLNALQASLSATMGNAFVTKLNPSGNALVYSTYLGGTVFEIPYGIAIDASGNAYITGLTESSNFPTMNPFQANLNGTFNAFVSKLNADGNALLYSTYLGGGGDGGRAIAVDTSGNAYVTGQTFSTNFPTKNPFQSSLGGTSNAFVTKFDAIGNALFYSTYLGGGNEDFGAGIAVDASGNAYVTGQTYSTNFPTKNAFQTNLAGNSNAFVTKLNTAGNALVFSTYLGGTGGSADSNGSGIAVDTAGNVYVIGETDSTNFPTKNPMQSSLTGSTNAFVTKFNIKGNALAFSTYLGGSGSDGGLGIAVARGSAYLTGGTTSSNFPTKNPLQRFCGSCPNGQNAFVAKLFLGATAGDFDGDGRADIAVWRPSSGEWFLIPSSAPTTFIGQQWGTMRDMPVRGDFDGDGKTDIAVFRPSNGNWFIIPSSNPNVPIVQQWGTQGDIPVPGDYDGSGKTEFAVFRPLNGSWFIIPSSNPNVPIVQQWGTQGDVPVPGDYDGDGKTDFAVFRPSNGTWFILPSSEPGTFIVQQWGTAGDIPVPGDYDGDGKADIAVFRPSNGTWFILPSSRPGTFIVQQWGTAGDIPVPADYDGDLRTDIAVWRPTNGTWYIIPSSTPTNFISTQFGTNGDVPEQKPIGQ